MILPIRSSYSKRIYLLSRAKSMSMIL